MTTATVASRAFYRSLSFSSMQLRALNPCGFSSSLSGPVNHTSSRKQSLQESQRTRHISIRQFHSIGRLRTAGDDSTIDFAYFPDTHEVDEDDGPRVPIMPNNYDTKTNAPAEIPAASMKPEISTMSADAVFLPMADLSDGHAMNIDFHAMADRVASNMKNTRNVAPEEQASLIKQIWNDLVDDMIGARKKSSGQ